MGWNSIYLYETTIQQKKNTHPNPLKHQGFWPAFYNFYSFKNIFFHVFLSTTIPRSRDQQAPLKYNFQLLVSEKNSFVLQI